MIGSEELAIFEVSTRDAGPRLARTRGVELGRCVRAEARVREALSSGRPVLPPGRDLTAVIPLKVDATVCGAVAVFRLLEQKRSLDATDHDLFDLLSRQAAMALLWVAARRFLAPTVRPPPRTAR
jgi:hypothetical protein